jgi:hypothetical protein
MIDYATPRRASAELDLFICGQLGTDKIEWLAVAKSEGGAVPVVVAETRVAVCWIALEQQEIRRHIFRGAAGTSG